MNPHQWSNILHGPYSNQKTLRYGNFSHVQEAEREVTITPEQGTIPQSDRWTLSKRYRIQTVHQQVPHGGEQDLQTVKRVKVAPWRLQGRWPAPLLLYQELVSYRRASWVGFRQRRLYPPCLAQLPEEAQHPGLHHRDSSQQTDARVWAGVTWVIRGELPVYLCNH